MRGVGVTDVKSLLSDRFLFGDLSGISVIMGRLHGLFLSSSSSDATCRRGEEQLFHNFTDCMKFAMCVDVRKAYKAMR